MLTKSLFLLPVSSNYSLVQVYLNYLHHLCQMSLENGYEQRQLAEQKKRTPLNILRSQIYVTKKELFNNKAEDVRSSNTLNQNKNKATNMKPCYLYTDGGSRGNPGIGGAGAVLLNDQNIEICRMKRFCGMSVTNNFCEYCALEMGLNEMIRRGLTSVEIRMDSLLIVNQINNKYRCKSTNLKELNDTIKLLLNQFTYYSIQHIPREQNKIADQLANEAMDMAIKE
ncbi:hypothetical protein WA158_006875 [Blastocystis sp. Blastoise]